ncbi:MAG: suppressor of fused domain protein [Cyclobacteriaceae bacterium]
MPEATVDNKQIAKYAAPILGINPSAQRFWDEDRKNSLDIFSVDDPTNQKMKFYGTIGVSDATLKIGGEEQSFRLELVIGGDRTLKKIPNILSTCGFYITKDEWECRPGAVFMRMVQMYYPEFEMKHVYFSPPFPWQDKLKPLQLETKKVVWLLAVPISEQELQYKRDNGDKALEALFEEHSVDVFDLKRRSII